VRGIVKRILLGPLAMILLIPGAYAALPGDSADGQRLHEANCMGCHNTSVYTRQNRQVRSLDALKQQLEGCGHVANKEFSAAETQNIIKYLNERFYHFQ
jgi:mono/diheme cytochrome c family protein